MQNYLLCDKCHHAMRTPNPWTNFRFIFLNRSNKFPVKKHYDTIRYIYLYIYRQCNYSNCGKAYKIIALRRTKHKIDPSV